MKKYCPINKGKVDENIARLNAFSTVLILVFSLIFSKLLVLCIGLLLTDYIFRASGYVNLSLLTHVNKKAAVALGLNKKYINAAPKEFAAVIGSVLSALILIFNIVGFYNISVKR